MLMRDYSPSSFLGHLPPVQHEWREVYQRIWDAVYLEFGLLPSATEDAQQEAIVRVFSCPHQTDKLLSAFVDSIDWSIERFCLMRGKSGQQRKISEAVLLRSKAGVWLYDHPVLQAEVTLPQCLRGSRLPFHDVADIWSKLGLHINLIYRGEKGRQCSAEEMKGEFPF